MNYQLLLFQDVFDLLVKAYGADPRIRDNAGKTPRQYMVASSQLQGGDMQVIGLGESGIQINCADSNHCLIAGDGHVERHLQAAQGQEEEQETG